VARLVLTLTLIVTLLCQSGCGVIFGYGNPQPVQVLAKLPDGQFVEGLAVANRGRPVEGTSGGTVYLHPAEEHLLTIADPSYRSTQQTIVRKIRIEIALLDALTLGIGLLVDYLSGSLYKLQPDVMIGIRSKGEAEALLNKAREEGAEPTTTGRTEEPTAAPEHERTDGIWVEDLDTGRKVFLPNDSAKCDACQGLRGTLTTCPHCGAGG
jgi:hypothetical protein